MTRPATHDVTRLLIDWTDGDQAALEQLTPLVYAELRRIAKCHTVHERPGGTLQATALVNEAYLRLVDIRRIRWQDRAHFFAVSARLMRRILVDFARRRGAQKRGNAGIAVTLDDGNVPPNQRAGDLVALDDALKQLSQFDERRGRVVELRFFGGLSLEETADLLNVSTQTVMRDWKLAKAWLLCELRKDTR